MRVEGIGDLLRVEGIEELVEGIGDLVVGIEKSMAGIGDLVEEGIEHWVVGIEKSMAGIGDLVVVGIELENSVSLVDGVADLADIEKSSGDKQTGIGLQNFHRHHIAVDIAAAVVCTDYRCLRAASIQPLISAGPC